MNSASAPRLAPPGAGIPAAELAWVRPVFALARGLMSDARATARFEREARRMIAWVAALTAGQAIQPVLIDRVVGIEDSSRYWSACMLLDHLRIVNEIIAVIITSLAAGRAFPQPISTADVKPSPLAGVDLPVRFESGVVHYLAAVSPALRHRTGVTHAHPWFGQLDAHGWHCLAAIHHTLHRRQLAAIRRGLSR